jgi:hypothetical protein
VGGECGGSARLLAAERRRFFKLFATSGFLPSSFFPVAHLIPELLGLDRTLPAGRPLVFCVRILLA